MASCSAAVWYRQKLSTEARMSSADLFHRNGFESALSRSMSEVVSALMAATLRQMPRLNFLVGEEREDALNLIEPWRTGRFRCTCNAVFKPAIPARSAGCTSLAFHDEFTRHGRLDLVEESAELCGSRRLYHLSMIRPVAMSRAAKCDVGR